VADLDRIYEYNRAVAEANRTWTEQQRRAYGELQSTIADANARTVDEYNSAGWQRWEKVHKKIVKLHKTFETGEGIPHAFAEYYASLADFYQDRREDCTQMHKKTAERVASANQLAQETLHKGYSNFVDAIQKAGELRRSDIEPEQDDENKDKNDKRAVKSQKTNK
jgi:hypothetical protein